MLEQVVTQVGFHYALLVFAGVGMGMELLLGIRYSQLVRKTLDMGKEEQPFTEQFKQNFRVDYQLGLNVNSVDKFVDNYVYKQKFMGIFLYTWEKLCGQVKIVSGFLAVLSIFFLFYSKCGKDVVINELVTILILCTMWITIVLLSGLGQKKKYLHNSMSEYLENTFIPRLKKETENPEQFSKLCRELSLKQANHKIAKQEKKELQEKRREKKRRDKKGRQELERVKQELVEELREEREKREQKIKQLEEEEAKARSVFEQAIKKEIKKQGIEKDCVVKKAKKENAPLEKEEENTEESAENTDNIEKTAEKLPEKNEKLLQVILREYLGEM